MQAVNAACCCLQLVCFSLDTAYTRVKTPTILPLSLVCLARGYLDHPDPRSQLLKLYSPECLRQDVSELILGVDVVGVDESFLNAVVNEVVPQLDMLASLVEDGILAQRRCQLAVHHELHTFSLPSHEFTE
jgi:hypothetical protein